jgi:curved DNA-binding protein CbpA
MREPWELRFKDYYQLLRLEPTATAEEVRRARNYLAQIYHTDRLANQPEEVKRLANEFMQEINEAYEVLTNEERRRSYDMFYRQHVGQRQSHTRTGPPQLIFEPSELTIQNVQTDRPFRVSFTVNAMGSSPRGEVSLRSGEPWLTVLGVSVERTGHSAYSLRVEAELIVDTAEPRSQYTGTLLFSVGTLMGRLPIHILPVETFRSRAQQARASESSRSSRARRGTGAHRSSSGRNGTAQATSSEDRSRDGSAEERREARDSGSTGSSRSTSSAQTSAEDRSRDGSAEERRQPRGWASPASSRSTDSAEGYRETTFNRASATGTTDFASATNSFSRGPNPARASSNTASTNPAAASVSRWAFSFMARGWQVLFAVLGGIVVPGLLALSSLSVPDGYGVLSFFLWAGMMALTSMFLGTSKGITDLQSPHIVLKIAGGVAIIFGILAGLLLTVVMAGVFLVFAIGALFLVALIVAAGSGRRGR